MRNKLRALWLSPEGAYTDEVIKSIADRLPSLSAPDRERVMPAIIRQWAKWQIDRERDDADPKIGIPIARKNLTRLKEHASVLAQFLSKLDKRGQYCSRWRRKWANRTAGSKWCTR